VRVKREVFKSINTVPAAELVDSPSGIHQFLFTRIKRMAGRAYVEVQIFAKRRARSEGIAAATRNGDLLVTRMDLGFHSCSALGFRQDPGGARF
jgi:hypothetical protein